MVLLVFRWHKCECHGPEGEHAHVEILVITSNLIKIPMIKVNKLINQILIEVQPSLLFPRLAGNYSNIF